MAPDCRKIVPLNAPIAAEPKTDGKPFDAGRLRSQNIIGQRLTQARRCAKISQKELARRLADYHLQVKPGSISKWETGEALPNPYQLFAVCHILGLEELMPLFTGRAANPCASAPELSVKGQNLLDSFKDMLIASGKFAPRSRKMAAAQPAPEQQVKVFSMPAAAGSGSFLEDEDYEMIGFDPDNIPDGTDFGIRVQGDSMLPRYVTGQIVFVRQCAELYSGDIGVFICNGSSYIKQYIETTPEADELENYVTSDGCVRPKITLCSLNRNRADCDVHVGPEDSLFIVGRVLS